MNENLREISFRNLVSEISDTGYLTHSIHYYPAKFIPQAVKYCISRYSKEGDIVIDPFAGSGTVGLEAVLENRSTYLLDLNPMLNHIIPLKIPTIKTYLSQTKLYEYIEQILESDTSFVPDWSKIDYWYPIEFLNRIQKLWGGLNNLHNSTYKLIIESSLLRISKKYSYAEHKVPKLFRSKRKIEQINTLAKKRWYKSLILDLYSLSSETLQKVNQTVDLLKNRKINIFFKGGVDSSTYNYGKEDSFDLLVSSPPYLQAQEYIRTAKLDLYWLGYSEAQIKELTKLEIPYRKPTEIISTPSLDALKEKIERKDLIELVDSYFCHTLNTFKNAMYHIKDGGIICIFIGNPKVDGEEVEIWKIFREYFEKLDFKLIEVLEDKIVTRQLFSSRNNKNPEGMKSEFMLIMRKN
ncbi:DNA methyltransferase [Ignavibacterium sp.]|uniref:DNA methyltransferase n=1 Tax=Ignavibacterium sp. TaxID=2651167 RepID=UPI0021FB4CE7|nr:DNA methyltransferase [Ignavibacterium sp.]BDQ01955.1 MAG: hypothetical protein KatS3mg037_0530 [Ignavibacterium sp.]